MQKRHYEGIAKAFAVNLNSMRKAAAIIGPPNDATVALIVGAEKMAADIADDVATYCATENEAFDRALSGGLQRQVLVSIVRRRDSMEFPFKGWDRGFNVMVLRMAELTAGAYTIGPDAPATLEALNAHVAQHKTIKVSAENSDQTIYGSTDVNYAARAWHDWTHWKYQLPFTPEGERAVYERQLVDMMAVYGVDSSSLRWAQMLYAEVIGQIEYKERWGTYPANQHAFNLAYLGDPVAAVSEGAFHPLKVEA